MRVGFGYDVHRLVQGRRLILGGIPVDYPQGLDGHSDADVLLHAITDAILGAAAMGDIGSHFPDTDPAFKDADSMELLKEIMRRVTREGYRLVNVDATIAAQEPKLRPYIDTMRSNIARGIGLSVGAVSVKATTTERLGFVGVGQGMAAYAVCLLEKI
jgi:2-C-methyl-D-erythritol 2,4-cyclodiphosphate synthase